MLKIYAESILDSGQINRTTGISRIPVFCLTLGKKPDWADQKFLTLLDHFPQSCICRLENVSSSIPTYVGYHVREPSALVSILDMMSLAIGT
jgi:hypothetical protein